MPFTMRSTLLLSSILFAGGSIAKPFEFLAPRASLTLVGCYSSSEGLTNETSYEFQSSGWCQDRCVGYNAAVFALTGGSDCLCGEELPPTSDKVASSKCNTECDGWPSDMCGGSGYYSVYTTGLEANVGTYGSETASASSSTSTATGSASINSTASHTNNTGSTVSTNSVGETVTMTAVSQVQNSADTQQQSQKENDTASIAAGVVVGVVGLAALCGAIFFFHRSRKQKSSGFGGGARGYGRNSQMPMTDSRFDGQYMAQRRQSNGSIDDDHDFSRRILQVTNPDR
ncbi:hypothetical protein N7488_006749 [Penicillium malachiteum]|nr:hypothetical protein N7488_006749 [Penicillium malachiteum]